MRRLLGLWFTLFLTLGLHAQTFSYSGYIKNADGSGAVNVPVKLYKRTTPNLTGFTSQTNYNGHSYYRSTGSMYWLDAKAACEAMNGHLATISNASENSFLYNTWPSGWIGYYQDKTGDFYGEPNAGWRWTDNYVTDGQQNIWDIKASGYTSGSTVTDTKNSKNITLYNSPSFTNSGGRYLTFNGSNNYGLTPDLSSEFGSSKVITILAWVYPTGNGVILDELGVASTSSGWHESVFEITGGNTLNIGFWNGAGITKVTSSITLNAWHLIGLTYNGTTLTGYKDGVSIGTVNFTRSAPHVDGGGGEVFAVGLADGTNMGSGAYGAFRFGGLQVYNTALTSDEMNRNYMSTAWRFGVYPYSAWNGGEPNNAGGEDYIQFVGGGLWNDLPNGVSLPYVLEFDYVVTYSSWSLYQTVYTNSLGYWSLSQSTNPATEWYIQIDSPSPVTTIQSSDLINVGNVILGTTTKKSLHWNMYDVNNDGKITITDKYYISARSVNRFNSWVSTPATALYTTSEYNILNTGTTNQKSTYPGVPSVTITSPVSGGSATYYLIAPGYSGQVTY